MPAAKLPPATLQNADDIEAAFYEAMQSGHIEKLMACWADEDDIVCVHPGGSRAVGSGAIRSTFEAMFANGAIAARPQSVRRVESLGAAVHSVVERVEILTPDGLREAFVQATNVYMKTPQGWRLVAHHASPGNLHDAQDGGSPTVLH